MWRARRRGAGGRAGPRRARGARGGSAPPEVRLLAVLATLGGLAWFAAGPRGLPELLAAMPPARTAVALSSSSTEGAAGRAAPTAPGAVVGPVISVEPARGPRAGGFGVLVRGMGFEAETNATVEGRWRLQAFVGDLPCVRTRWVAPGALRCVVPPGAGLDLSITVRRCVCPQDEAHWHLPSDAEGSAPLTPPHGGTGALRTTAKNELARFHFDEDLMAAAAASETAVAPPWAGASLLAQSGHLVAPAAPGKPWRLRSVDPVKNASFLALLPDEPRPGHVDRLRQILDSGDFGAKYQRCAVVGQSPRLRGNRLGASIDSLDAVFRVDLSPSGHHTHWNRDVGNRTTFQVVGSKAARELLHSMVRSGDKTGAGGGAEEGGGVSPLVAPWGPDQQPHVVLWGSDASIHAVKLDELRRAAGETWQPALLAPGLSAGLQSYLRRLHTAAGGPALLGGPYKESAPTGPDAREMEGPAAQSTSLLQAAVLASHMCDSVEVFGGGNLCQRAGSAKCRRAYHTKWAPTDVQARVADAWEQLSLVALGETGLVDLATPASAIPFEDTWAGRFGPQAPARPVGAPLAPPAPPPPPLRSDSGFCDEGSCARACSNRGQFLHSPDDLDGRTSAEFFPLGPGGGFHPGCECDPLYSGTACDTDLLDAGPGAKLVAGLSPRFPGDLLLTQAGARLSEGKAKGKGPWYETPLMRDPAGRETYLFHRSLYNALPERDAWLLKEPAAARAGLDGGGPPLPTFGTCAVVGNSGALAHSSVGADIDAHDVVWRFNQAPTAGFEKLTGGRTTHEGVNSFWLKAMMDYEQGQGGGAGQTGWDNRSGSAAAVFFELFDPSAFRDRGPEEARQRERMWQSRIARFLKLRREREAARGGHAVLLLVSPAFVGWAHGFYADLRERMEESLGPGRFGPSPKPESGFLATLLLHQVCEKVEVYGFSSHRDGDRGDPSHPPYHYYDDAVPRRGSHAFGLSLAAFRALSVATGGAIVLRD